LSESGSQQPGQMKRVKCGQGWPRWGEDGRGGVAAQGHKIAFSWQNG